MRMWLRSFVLALAHRFGTKIIDQRSGAYLGRAILLPWRGKIHVVGLETPVRVMWQPQGRITYWKQEIGFATHPPVDFPKQRSDQLPGESSGSR